MTSHSPECASHFKSIFSKLFREAVSNKLWISALYKHHNQMTGCVAKKTGKSPNPKLNTFRSWNSQLFDADQKNFDFVICR